jgi:hypothetical protein
MRALGFIGILLLSSAIPWAVAAQPVDEWVEGPHRVCAYPPDPGSDDVRQYNVGVGEACPAYYPIRSTNLPAPPTARLLKETVIGGTRVCRYAQRGREWRFDVALDKRCPLTAGMVETERTTDNSR